jgi:hypothetical protein
MTRGHVPAHIDLFPGKLIESSVLDRIAAFAADDLALTDEAMGATFLGPAGLLLWLQTSAADPLTVTTRRNIRFAEIVEFRDGKIARMRALRDATELLRETGLLT